ncbi:hypothetical protein ABS764_14945 [Flavobacterium sp. ST-87]|uniref:Uncharacterized protein n=1 Tax=Flavobacterium plantiphilum TaxID=3163297 RepID=A0ABW8XXV2_9FLAO
MKGLLKETSEIKKLQEEFKALIKVKQKETPATKKKQDKLIPESCEL